MGVLPPARAPVPPAAEIHAGSIFRRHLLVAGATAAIVFLLLAGMGDLSLRFLSAWTAALVATLTSTWHFILVSTPEEARAKAKAADPGGVGILLVFVFASLANLLGAILVVAEPQPTAPDIYADLEVWLVLLGVASGWFLMHTAFALHYARLYWGGDAVGGLAFPGESPDDVDFAYFSFGVGMAFQVSDVTTTTTSMRRTVLVHAMLAFVYNSAILALTINLLAGRF